MRSARKGAAVSKWRSGMTNAVSAAVRDDGKGIDLKL